MKSVFIDGESGTTGLQVRERLARHPQIEVVSIDPELKRDANEKRRLMREVDVAVLCLPDAAAKEAAALAQEAGCRVLDASSAHRTAEGWVFGLPELNDRQRVAIAGAQCVANPGCYATGAILMLAPLVSAGVLSADDIYAINAVSGYSGGGKQLIERYESGESQNPAVAAYGLDFQHKHVREIQVLSGLAHAPIFIPSVGDYRQGMLVSIPLQEVSGRQLDRLLDTFEAYYRAEDFVKLQAFNTVDPDTAPFLTPHGLDGSNEVHIHLFGSEDGSRGLLVAKLDNLGKGASGAAVQNLNLMLGLDESLGVDIR
ncbi:N-acetyl-gamma-glutamyl-phosphate reductase [Billgrantia kenyensis]|uniref:N-acetyl-gamma-glutamyl-phosphate reductase n=1 Tax=Billgrantia kenyensis TaxID=321266 RepID=A0A7W0AE25_9GAMM|nr:N-acetyl-gamma-glutamyl-phosphate reductase [Halomonas kenyensis]MBA2779110.1 N-acetyl-gamma-glutamyl-phosphate reductase [Halomonas kenyensis]MCG6660537.1 N-acetyl-gamma-glutamyl-phosphate reductase [Halomonas kenyensis]